MAKRKTQTLDDIVYLEMKSSYPKSWFDAISTSDQREITEYRKRWLKMDPQPASSAVARALKSKFNIQRSLGTIRKWWDSYDE